MENTIELREISNFGLTTVDESTVYIGYNLVQIRTLYIITTLGVNQFASMTSVESLRIFANRISFLEEHWTAI
jgi:hypothetical protein